MKGLNTAITAVLAMTTIGLAIKCRRLVESNNKNERLKWQYLTIALKSVQFVRLNQRDKDALAPFQIDYEFKGEDE